MINKIDLKKPQKLSAISIVLSVLYTIKKLWPFFLVFIFQLISKNKDGKSIWEKMGYLTVIFVSAIVLNIVEIFKYFTTTFFLNDDNEFVLKTGLFTKKVTIIPLYKIQSFQSSQSILNRISNTYKVNIETAGSKETEVQLLAISLEQIQALQQALELHNNKLITPLTEVLADDTNETKQIKLGIVDFFRMCISENHLKTLGIVAAFIFGKLEEFKDVIGKDLIGEAFDKAEEQASNIKLVATFIVVLLTVTFFISCVLLALRFFGYAVKLDSKKMYLQWGLLSTQQKTIYYNKIQMLDWHSNGLRRLLKLSVLRVFATGEDEGKHEGQINIPITNQSQIEAIQPFYQNNLAFDIASFLKIDKSFTLRYTILIGFPIFIVLFTIAFLIKKWTIIFPIFWIIYFIVSKKVFQNRFKLWVNKDCIKIEQGVWGTENILLNWKNIQSIALRTSPYQRSHDLRDIILFTAGKQVIIHYLPLHQAQFINDYALYKLECKL